MKVKAEKKNLTEFPLLSNQSRKQRTPVTAEQIIEIIYEGRREQTSKTLSEIEYVKDVGLDRWK